VPLLLVHGWPGSLVEFLEFIPLLATGNDQIAIEVVAPHIPGYGFSSAPAHAGFSAVEAADMFQKLMLRLGHKQFYTQGGDWGSIITTALATTYPENVLGLHLNMPVSVTPGTLLKNVLVQLPPLKYLLVHAEDFHKVGLQPYMRLLQETGYLHIQATKPDTVGLALSSSPLGLAGYILEKFSTWTNPELLAVEDGGLRHHTIPLDAMLTDVMLYWTSNCITSSQRFYKENFMSGSLQVLSQIPIRTATGIADTPYELFLVPRASLAGKFPNIVQYTRFKKGGHFVAMELPTEMAADVLKFVQKVESMDGRGGEL
jgi:pimeloyl-ACP methyl ester carboxylesterase